jgi:hypothetical protein
MPTEANGEPWKTIVSDRGTVYYVRDEGKLTYLKREEP